jgi:hypothetical protein
MRCLAGREGFETSNQAASGTHSIVCAGLFPEEPVEHVGVFIPVLENDAVTKVFDQIEEPLLVLEALGSFFIGQSLARMGLSPSMERFLFGKVDDLMMGFSLGAIDKLLKPKLI